MEDSAGDNKVRTVDSFKKVVINVATYLLLLGICLGSTFSVLAILGSRSNGLCKLPNVPRHGSYIVVDDLEATPEELLRSAHLKYSCESDYDLIGVKDVFCTNGNWSAKYPFCLHKKRTCLLPPYPAHGTYEGFEMGDVVPGQATVGAALIIKCNPGYGTHGTRSMVCFNGKWSGNIPDCVKLCYLDEDPSVEYHCVCPDSMPHNYQCKCNRYEPHGTIVKPRCSKNYVYFKELYDMRCVNGKWNYVAHCRPVKNPKPRLPKQTYKCGLVTPEAKQLMANARSAKRNELPWMVGIYDSESGHVQLICGGTIISETAILLSAHCLVKNDTVRRHAADIKVGAGKLFSDWNAKMDDHAQKFDVKKIILHKDFAGSEGNLDHDIALIILKKDIVFQSNIRPACLNFNPEIVQKQLQAGNRGLVAGWGLNENGTTSPTLQVAELPFVPLDVCAYSFPVNYQEFLTEDKFCAGYTNGTAVCQGDSGGGMAFPWLFQGEVRYIVQGITSSSPDANPKLPCDPYWRTIFTQISKYDKFIRYNVNDLVIPVL